MRSSSRRVRLAAVLAAGGFVAFLPATAVSAQQDAGWKPDPLTTAQAHQVAPPPEPPAPPTKYKQENQCVQPGTLDSGEVYPEASWGQKYLRIEEAHRFATGKGQKVAVIDTGVSQHEFMSQVQPGGDYVEEGGDGRNDCDGHGTEVAGIIAANPPRGEDIGFRGVAPNARILSIRQTSGYFIEDKEGNQQEKVTAGNRHTLAQAIRWAAHNTADVINISVDNCRPADRPMSPGEREMQAAVRLAVDEYNAVVVASAGNTGQCKQNNQADPGDPKNVVTPPWFAEDVLSVAAVNKQGSVAEFSMWGPWVSVAAPGTEIVSLDPARPDQLANLQAKAGEKPAPIQGTSFAAPYVSGTAALVREKFPNLTARQVMERIKATAQHPASPDGRDSYVGYGVIDPIGALTDRVPGQDVPREQNEQAALPDPAIKDWTPFIVAVSGAGGAITLLGITLFTVHAVRRKRGQVPDPRGYA